MSDEYMKQRHENTVDDGDGIDTEDDDELDDLYDEYDDQELAIELNIHRFGYGPPIPIIPWTEKPPLRNDERVYDKGQAKEAFRQEQQFKLLQDFSRAPDQPTSQPVLHTPGHSIYFKPAPDRKSVGLYLCQVCRTEFAAWPTEIAKKFRLFGIGLTVTLRTPIACTNCRIMRFTEVSRLGRLDHRPVWKNIFALVTGSEPPVLSLRMRSAMRLRRSLRLPSWGRQARSQTW